MPAQSLPRPLLSAQKTGIRNTICPAAAGTVASPRGSPHGGSESGALGPGARSPADRFTVGHSQLLPALDKLVHEKQTAGVNDWSVSVRRIYSQARVKLAKAGSSGNIAQSSDSQTTLTTLSKGGRKFQRTIQAVKSSASEGLKVRRAAMAFQDVLKERRARLAEEQAELERQREHERRVAEWRVTAVANVVTELESFRSEKRKSQGDDIKAADVLQGIDNMLGKLKSMQGEMAVKLSASNRVSVAYEHNLEEVNRLVRSIHGESYEAPAGVARAAVKLARAASTANAVMESPQVLPKPKPAAPPPLEELEEEDDEQAAPPFVTSSLSLRSNQGSSRSRLIQAAARTIVRVPAPGTSGRRETIVTMPYGPPSNAAKQASRRRSRGIRPQESKVLDPMRSFQSDSSRSSIFSHRSSVSSNCSSWRDSVNSLPAMERIGDDAHAELDELLASASASPHRSRKLWRLGRAAALVVTSPHHQSHTIVEGAEEAEGFASEEDPSPPAPPAAGPPAPPALALAELEVPETMEESPRWRWGPQRSMNSLQRFRSQKSMLLFEDGAEAVEGMASPRRAPQEAVEGVAVASPKHALQEAEPDAVDRGFGPRSPRGLGGATASTTASSWAGGGQELLPRLKEQVADENGWGERPPHSASSEPQSSACELPRSPALTARPWLSPRPPPSPRPPRSPRPTSARSSGLRFAMPSTTIEGILLERKHRGLRKRCLASPGDEPLWRRYAGSPGLGEGCDD